MKSTFLGGVAALALCPAAAMAIGLDRSGQPVDILFEDGNYFELSFGRVFPSVSGEGNLQVNPLNPTGTPLNAGGEEYDDVAEAFSQLGAALKYQFTDQFSMAVIAGQPYGVDISYPGSGAASVLGGTSATLDSSELTALARYEFTENYSVHGGLRYVRLGDGNVTLSGVGYGTSAAAAPAAPGLPNLNGYNVEFGEDSDIGYAIGAAYERPDIALRVAVTYLSKTDHELPTNENVTLSSPDTQVQTAEAVNLDFQTGLNQRTLLFGQIRYAWYDDVKTIPEEFGNRTPEGTSLTSIEDNWALSLGVGRQLTDKLAGSVTIGYEPEGEEFGSPLAPTNGQKSIGLGLSYDVSDQVTLAGGIRYVDLGDANPSTGFCDATGLGQGCASFEDNHVVGLGLQIGYRF